MHTTFLTSNTPKPTVMNQACPLTLLGGALETPGKWDTSKEARDFKIGTELPGNMHTS